MEAIHLAACHYQEAVEVHLEGAGADHPATDFFYRMAAAVVVAAVSIQVCCR